MPKKQALEDAADEEPRAPKRTALCSLCFLCHIISFSSAFAVTLGQHALITAFKSWGWAQTIAFYGFVPLVLYAGYKRAGFTSLSDMKNAWTVPLT